MSIFFKTVRSAYINLSNLFWAEVTVSNQDAKKRWIDLTYGDLRLHLIDQEAEDVIAFLELHSQASSGGNAKYH
jgi:hypothetical protein